MSLFKARDWWSTSVGEAEEFGPGCLCVANIDNGSDGLDKVVTGSYQGILRVYNPRPTKQEDGWSGYRPEDVLLESSLPNPILQVEAGVFASGSDLLHLAVLHSRKLAVYNVSVMSGAVDHGRQYQLKKTYEHNLQRAAFNFCYGPFGSVRGKDFICVQSMDGTVSIFEQESFSFSRFLPGALLPGPIKYIPKLDSFVTASSSWQLECYKYQVLAVATDSKTKEESQSMKSGKRVNVSGRGTVCEYDWCFNIGEQAVDIFVTQFQQNAPQTILVLGERTIFCLTETGKLKFMKKMECDPSCFLPYASVSDGGVNYLVGSHTKSLMVYQDCTLKWAAKLDNVPMQVCVGTFSDLKGVLVTLSDEGRLECSYLGTDPALFIPPTTEARELNYPDMDREMAMLQKKIKQLANKSVIVPSVKQEDDLTISCQVNSSLDEPSVAMGMEYEDVDGVPSITVRIQLKARLLLEKIKVMVHVDLPLASSSQTFDVSDVDPNKPSEHFVSFFVQGKGLPTTLTATISANYISASGAPRVATGKVKLPIKLVVKPVLPVKNAEYKITLDSNKPPANLLDIFTDLSGENAGGQGAALGFQYYGGPIVTVLASKTSQRYRLQCDKFEGLWLVTKEMVGRLNNHFSKGKVESYSIYFSSQLPLQEYFDLIDSHFEHRLNAKRCSEMLAQRASQFRAIQRRLLTRFKDKTPAPLGNLDTLLEGTYRQLLHLADAVEDNNKSQDMAANSLNCGTRLFNLLIRLWTSMSDDEFKVLQQTITPVVPSSQEQGWEESVDASVTHLLRTTLAKSAKDQTLNPQPLQMPDDTTKVKKHIALMCDKLGKGGRLVEGMPTNTAVNMAPSPRKEKKNKISATSKTVMENGHIDTSDDTETLIGSQFGKQKHKRKEADSLSYPNGMSELPALGLPVENRPDEGVEFQKKKQIEAMVPDLDDMADHMEGPGLVPLED
ncbi:protein PTHB1-like isoform X1 [Pecten maximus]|uniref:protein PTHB1-like isoform X1 n=1 Tax=Pecten maximus TaxID=6579 RepID=UPI001458EBC7|nr:protein PTHB1-like isoform X1 [Pecten maximus]